MTINDLARYHIQDIDNPVFARKQQLRFIDAGGAKHWLDGWIRWGEQSMPRAGSRDKAKIIFPPGPPD